MPDMMAISMSQAGSTLMDNGALAEVEINRVKLVVPPIENSQFPAHIHEIDLKPACCVRSK